MKITGLYVHYAQNGALFKNRIIITIVLDNNNDKNS